MLGPLHFDGGNLASSTLTYSDPLMLPWEHNPPTYDGNRINLSLSKFYKRN
jgi:hypothetical protein